MSRLREDMKVIPGVAWAIAICCYLGFAALAWLVMIPRDPKVEHLAAMGSGNFCGGHSDIRGDLCLAGRLCKRGRPAAGHAIHHVDAAGHFHSQRDRNHSVLPPARPAAERLSQLWNGGEPRIRVLFQVRHGSGARLSRVPLGGAARLVALHQVWKELTERVTEIYSTAHRRNHGCLNSSAGSS